MTTNINEWLAEEEARVMAADWHNIPRGHYAITVVEDDEPFRVLGYKLFERKVSRTYANGRTVGSDAWVRRYALADGITTQEFFDYWEIKNAGEYSRASDIDWVLAFTDECRRDFGRLTGRCGCCGKALTDPDSKMRGIGPECIKGLTR